MDERERWQQWREERRVGLSDPHGWLSVIGMVWLTGDFVGVTGFPGRWRGRRAGLGWTVEVEFTASDAVTRFDERVTGCLRLDLDDEESDLSLVHGTVLAEVGVRGDRPMVRLRDSSAAQLNRFDGVPVFDFDPEWVIEADYTPYDLAETRAIDTAQPGVGGQMTFGGSVHVVLPDGSDVDLDVTGEDGESQSVLFHDASNGTLTADWRYVPLTAATLADEQSGPESLGQVSDSGLPRRPRRRVQIDFNRSMNFPAAFSPWCTCPRPTPDNVIPVAVAAGEQRPR